MISAPLLCMIRRMILMAASCPSNKEAAVTILTLFCSVKLIIIFLNQLFDQCSASLCHSLVQHTNVQQSGGYFIKLKMSKQPAAKIQIAVEMLTVVSFFWYGRRQEYLKKCVG
jgi:hypothetical protein